MTVRSAARHARTFARAVFALLLHLNKAQPVTDLWVVTTQSDDVIHNLDCGFLRPLQDDSRFSELTSRIYVAKGIEDICMPPIIMKQ